MNDFITLACPICGGKLEISPSTASLKCQYCGTEHIVRRESGNILLEAFAQCPICHRNDKVMKVSGIVSTHAGNLPSLMPPYQPQPQTFSLLLMTFGILCVIVGLCFGCSGFLNVLAFAIGGSEESTLAPGLILLLSSIVGIGLSVVILKIYFIHGKKESERVSAEEPRWRRAMEKWNQLYYCERDDIVYDPSNNSYATASETTRFLYQNN